METQTEDTRIARILSALRERMGQPRAFASAAGLSVLWLAVACAYGFGFFGWFDEAAPERRAASALEIALFLFAVVAPIALFFYGAMLARKAEEIREETQRLAEALNTAGLPVPRLSMPREPERRADLAAAATAAARAALAEEKAAITASLKALEDRLAATQEIVTRIEGRETEAQRASKVTAPPPPADSAQPALPLEPEAPAPAAEGIRWDSVVRALDFPRDEHDRKGFAALRAALKEREFAELLQAAEDVLTLLASEGVYMEDLDPEPATVEQWENYSNGARGAEVAAIGGVTDEAALEKVRARMRRDVIFRDTALHFLRRYDRLVARMRRELGPDPMIVEAANSRTGRAFMIIARVTGAFD